jgi:hypothetical protein
VAGLVRRPNVDFTFSFIVVEGRFLRSILGEARLEYSRPIPDNCFPIFRLVEVLRFIGKDGRYAHHDE